MMNPAFRRVALVGKQTPEIALSLRALRDLLRKRGCEVLVEKETAAIVGDNGPAAGYDEIGRGADLAIVVGGDGTMLAAARNLARHKVPLAGINQGRLGFMTDIALSEMSESIGAILEGRHTIEERTLIEAEILRGGKSVLRTVALNEAVVTKGSEARLIEFKLAIDGEYVYRLRADGVIVATPTGSTAYAMSAQGPILQPTVRAFALVPLNPHVLSTRARISTASRLPTCRKATASCSSARPTRSASCTHRATATSPCCARSCAGARRSAASQRTDLSSASSARCGSCCPRRRRLRRPSQSPRPCAFPRRSWRFQ